MKLRRAPKVGTFTMIVNGKATRPIPYNAGYRRIRWASFRARLPMKVRCPVRESIARRVSYLGRLIDRLIGWRS